jgi:hypothetical protein
MVRFLFHPLSPNGSKSPSFCPDEPGPDPHYKRLVTRFYFEHAMLVINSFRLQDGLGPAGFLRHSPDSHFVVFTWYAVLPLLKMCRRELHAFWEDERLRTCERAWRRTSTTRPCCTACFCGHCCRRGRTR